MIMMGVDLGARRTGIAVCDPMEMLASPVCVIDEPDREQLLSRILLLIRERKPQLLIVGLPRNMDGTEGESAQGARAFAKTLSEQSGIPYKMVDERGTTVTAHGYLTDAGCFGKKRKAATDAVAAVIILQSYLDATGSR